MVFPEFKSVYYTQHKNNYSKDFVFEKRKTTCYELVYFLDDSNCKMYLDGNYYSITGDTVVFRHPNQINQSFMPYESILICFEINSIDLCAFVKKLKVCNKDLKQTEYRKLFEDVYKESLTQNQHVKYYAGAKIMEILYNLHNEKNLLLTHNSGVVTNEKLMNILRYITININNAFTIRRMSVDLNISERLIYKLFKEKLKLTPIEYLNECRLNYARKLLNNSNITINEIALMSGYNNPTYFITLFKNKYGLTPLQYRKLGRD